MKMPIKLLLKAFRELDELAARFKSAVSMPAPLRRIFGGESQATGDSGRD